MSRDPHLGLAPLEGVREAGVLAREGGKGLGLEEVQDALRLAGLAHARGDRDRASAVAALDGGVGPARLHGGHLGEGHLASARRPQQQALDAVLVDALLAGKSHQDLHLVATALQASL